jgi:hypothetical protein
MRGLCLASAKAGLLRKDLRQKVDEDLHLRRDDPRPRIDRVIG